MSKFKVGDQVTDNHGSFGEVVKIDTAARPGELKYLIRWDESPSYPSLATNREHWHNGEGLALTEGLAASEPVETVDNNPKTRAGGTNKVPFHLIPPRALAYVAICFADGGFKYQPYNFYVEKISSSVYYGAMLRHIFAWWSGERLAPDGHHHLAHAACCLIMVLSVEGTDMLNDNRPPPVGDWSALMDELAAEIPKLRERENTKFDLHDIPEHDHG